MTWTCRTRAIALSIVLLGLCACGGGGSTQDSSQQAGATSDVPRHLVLVTVDTLRADHMGAYGYPRETTPFLDGLAAEGVVFENAYSTSGTTIPSHLSMFTGLLPHQHGYLRNQSASLRPIRPVEQRPTLAEALGAAGYLTAGFVSAAPVSRRAGMHVGFEVFSDPKEASRAGTITNKRLLRWLRKAVREGEVGPQRPMFLWIHYWDVHEPNDPPEPYRSMFPRDAELAQIAEQRGIDPAGLSQAFDAYYRARHFHVPLYRERGREVTEGEVPAVTTEQVLDLLARYDGDVRSMDDALAEVVGVLRELGLWDQTVFTLTADHGQSLGQHNWLEHGRVTDENVRVPWIVRAPGLAPRRARGIASTIDLGPTLAGLLGPVDIGRYLALSEGRDALGSDGARPFALAQRSDRQVDRDYTGTQVVLTGERWKLVYSPGASPLLYDLDADPLETTDVASEHPDVVAKWQQAAETELARRPAGPGGEQAPLDSELARELESLGYAGDE